MEEPNPAVAGYSSRQFCDYIVHELANPLSGMLMSVEIIRDDLEANPPGKKETGRVLGILRKEINRLILMLNDLRSSGVMADINMQPTSLSVEISELLALESVEYEHRGIRVFRFVPLGLPRIMADRDKLRQVLLHFCKNAVEAMPDGGTLTLRSYVRQDLLCLDISDTGIDGTPEQSRGLETAVTNKQEFGLAIIREIVKQHKGTLSCTRQAGKGAKVQLRFPIQGE